MAYVIVSGNCNIACYNSKQRLTILEYAKDPTKAIRDQEDDKTKNDNDLSMSMRPLLQNGYISNTLKTV
jgi:hypothetical protein